MCCETWSCEVERRLRRRELRSSAFRDAVADLSRVFRVLSTLHEYNFAPWTRGDTPILTKQHGECSLLTRWAAVTRSSPRSKTLKTQVADPHSLLSRSRVTRSRNTSIARKQSKRNWQMYHPTEKLQTLHHQSLFKRNYAFHHIWQTAAPSCPTTPTSREIMAFRSLGHLILSRKRLD